MPCLSAQYNPAIGPLIGLYVSPPTVMTHSVSGATPSPSPAAGQSSVLTATALIDTGASITSITRLLAAQAGLPLIGRRSLGTAGGVVSANLYVADIGVPFGNVPASSAGSQIHVAGATTAMMQNIPIMEFDCPSPHFKMLLGRDIICQGVFSLAFDQRYVFSL